MRALLFSVLSLVIICQGTSFAESQNPDVKALEDRTLQARPLPLNQVRLLGGPLKRAQDVTVEYLLQLEPDRMLVDGRRIGHQEVTRSRPPRLFDVEYLIAAVIVKGKQKVTVRFEASEGNSIASVFGIRMIRAETKR